MNGGDGSARLGLTGWPAAAEEAVIARDVLLAGHVGARLHVCHVSTPGSVELPRRAQARGPPAPPPGAPPPPPPPPPRPPGHHPPPPRHPPPRPRPAPPAPPAP